MLPRAEETTRRSVSDTQPWQIHPVTSPINGGSAARKSSSSSSGTITVQVVCANNLPFVRTNFMHTANPYCVVVLSSSSTMPVGALDEAGDSGYRTRVCRATCHPRWDQFFCIPDWGPQAPVYLHIAVLDQSVDGTCTPLVTACLDLGGRTRVAPQQALDDRLRLLRDGKLGDVRRRRRRGLQSWLNASLADVFNVNMKEESVLCKDVASGGDVVLGRSGVGGRATVTLRWRYDVDHDPDATQGKQILRSLCPDGDIDETSAFYMMSPPLLRLIARAAAAGLSAVVKHVSGTLCVVLPHAVCCRCHSQA